MTISSKGDAIAHLVAAGNHDEAHATLAVELMSRFYYMDDDFRKREDYWDMITRRIESAEIYSKNGNQGWVDRNGKLWCNTYASHSVAANMLMGMDTEMLENAGWIHVSCNSFPLRDFNCTSTRRTSERQRRRLREWGIEIDTSYEMRKQNPKPEETLELDLDGFTHGGVRKFSLREVMAAENEQLPLPLRRSA